MMVRYEHISKGHFSLQLTIECSSLYKLIWDSILQVTAASMASYSKVKDLVVWTSTLSKEL